MKRFLLFLGPILFIFSFLLPLERKLSFSIGLVLWMGVWWVGEVLPLYVTALLPLVLAPLFGILTPQEVSVNYARPTVFLFLGGFIIARALEKYNIHLYLTQRLVRIFGRSEIGFLGYFPFGLFFINVDKQHICNSGGHTYDIVPRKLRDLESLSFKFRIFFKHRWYGNFSGYPAEYGICRDFKTVR